jgi:hypothetical protein
MATQNFFFADYFLKLHLHHFSKIKSHKEVTKHKVFLTNFVDYRRIRILVLLDPDPEGPKTYGSADSQHCLQ